MLRYTCNMKSQHSFFSLLNYITELRFPEGEKLLNQRVGHFNDSCSRSKSITNLHCYKQQKFAIVDITIFYTFDIMSKDFIKVIWDLPFRLQTLVIQGLPKSVSTFLFHLNFVVFFSHLVKEIVDFYYYYWSTVDIILVSCIQHGDFTTLCTSCRAPH